MKPSHIERFFRALACSLLLAAVASANPAWGGQRLHGQVPAAAKRHPTGRLDGSKQLNLAIGLPLRNGQTLTNLLRDLYDPASPRYQQYLTASQFAAQFGPTEKDYQAVAQFARAHGLTVAKTHPNRTLLDVNGKVADIEAAFHVRLRVYKHPNEARTFFAPDTGPSLDLTVPVLGISGLDDYELPHPMSLRKDAFDSPTNAPGNATGSGPSGYFIGSDFRAAYAPGVALNGAGQSVGLFELDGYFSGDILEYESLAGIPNISLTNVLLDGFDGSAGENNLEVALDIEMAMSMAPGLNRVMVYEGTTPNDVLNQMATDNQAKQLSSSWGFGPPVDLVRDQIYLQFAAQGQSMFQASGDSGAYASSVDSPSDDPNITIVGGTSLTTSGPGGAWASETTWFGSGGGISAAFSIPAWQQGLNMSVNQGSTIMRNIPDVACLADVLIWLVADNGQEGPIGGTSAAAPLWAGFTALVNQQAAAATKPTVGFVNPALYALGQSTNYSSSFHDITTGNNTNAGSPTNFFAVAGYDLCTGWGTPAGNNLINALVSPPDALGITPVTNEFGSGPVGGPFNPAWFSVVLTNIGTNALNWSMTLAAPWIEPTLRSGSLTPGGASTLVALGLTEPANSLAVGRYTATLWFTNQADGKVQSRNIILDVVTAPSIARQPAPQNVPLGATAAFSVGTASNALLYFQWRENGTNLSDGGGIVGSATSALAISNVTAGDIGTYTVVVSNAAGVEISQGAALTILPSAPVILSQPASQSVSQGSTAIFTVQAAGNMQLLYQWQCNQTNLTDGGSISGSSSSALTLANVLPGSAGTYSVIVSNALGATNSIGASLTVNSWTASGVTLTTLYSFTGGTDGLNPNALMQETNGNFYGTTQGGGGPGFAGTVFQFTPAGALTTIDSFSVSTGGFVPLAGLLQATDGNLYGTTEDGGTRNNGVIFRTTTNGILTNLVLFNGNNGSVPSCVLMQAVDGGIYGTTVDGGAEQDGVLFRITTNGAFTELVSFNGSNGINPNELYQAADGTFYGTSINGGLIGEGNVFHATTNGALNSIASFGYTNGNGYLLYGGLAPTPQGNFVGTSYEGGANGLGTIFQMSPDGSVNLFYSFTGGSDGAHPAATLIAGNDGNYYGTTAYGGASDDGTVFRLTPDGVVESLVQFDGYDGANPQTRLVLATDGNLYGTTQNGGVNGDGAIFRVNMNEPGLQISGQPADQDGFLGANASFSVAVIGNPPFYYQWRENGTNLADGPNIVGSTNRVLTLLNLTASDSGVYSVLVSNTGNSVLSRGASLGVIVSPPQITLQPASQTQLVGDVAVLSVTAIGDLPLSYQWQKNGTNLTDVGQIAGSSASSLSISNLFETNGGTYTVIVSNAVAPVTSDPAVLAVFAASAPGTTMAAMHAFTGGADGGTPNALVLGSDGLLYGTTQTGGSNGYGTIFSLDTNGNLTTLVSFAGTNGAMPVAGLVQDSNGVFFGTTKLGGSNSAGTIFSLTTNGVLTSIYSFATGGGSVGPFTALSLDPEGYFYGAATNYASPANGIIFKMAPGGGAASNLYTFPGGTSGALPTGALALGPDGNFYGSTQLGGAHSEGNIYRLTPQGAETNLYSFTGGTDGFYPVGGLALGADGNFYGVTRRNVISNEVFYGTVFKVTPSGGLTTLYAFNPGLPTTGDGAIPFAGLIQASDGNFYGTTLEGLYNTTYGTVFLVTPGGSLSNLTAFNNSDDGAYPETSLTEGADGFLYGTTSAGGAGGHGTIYRISFTSPPQILTQPSSQTNVAGAAALFSVTVFGAPVLSCQWRKNGIALTDGGEVSGSATRVLTLNPLGPNDAATYSVIVTNALGTTASRDAMLTVIGAPGFQSVTQSNGTVTFTWSAALNQSYQVQYSPTLNPPQWVNLGGTILATNTITGTNDTIQPGGQRFYRVVLSP